MRVIDLFGIIISTILFILAIPWICLCIDMYIDFIFRLLR
jgi:hypothetical protein